MPVVTVHMEKGRSIEMKRALAENWAVGGQLQLDKFGPGYGRVGVQD